MVQWLVILHAFGQRYDLPVPLALFVFGGAAVVFVSFLFVLPRAARNETLATTPDGETTFRLHPIAASISGILFLALIVAGFAGSQVVAENIMPTAFWLLIWIAVPISCAIVGDWTRPVNPFAALAILADRPRLRHAVLGGPAVQWPSWLGWWPAVGFFFVVACGELIYNATATLPAVTAFGMVIYALITMCGALVFGSAHWLARAELFSVLFNTWGRLGFFRFGMSGTRGLGGGLKVAFEPVVSRITFVLLLLVSVSFDGLLATPAWQHTRGHLGSGIAPGTTAYLLLTTLAFVRLAAIAWAFFGGFSAAVRGAGALESRVTTVTAGLLPSLLPIAFGYLLAHNAEYLTINGQLLLPLLGNPAGMSWWPRMPYPFNDSYELNFNLLPSSIVWYSQVALIVFVHIAAVILAHDYLTRAARTIRNARRAEWPWIANMVLYTMSSLWLLAQPLVKGG